jgi:hypothetical protein
MELACHAQTSPLLLKMVEHVSDQDADPMKRSPLMECAPLAQHILTYKEVNAEEIIALFCNNWVKMVNVIESNAELIKDSKLMVFADQMFAMTEQSFLKMVLAEHAQLVNMLMLTNLNVLHQFAEEEKRFPNWELVNNVHHIKLLLPMLVLVVLV